MSGLISSLLKPLIAQVVDCQSSREVWLSLESSFVLVSQARVIQTQLQLALLKKWTNSNFNYYRCAKTLDDIMAIARRPLPPFKFVSYLLAGLGIEYDAIVSFVTTCLDPISYEELLGHLLAHKAQLFQHSNAALFHTEAYANFIAKTYSP